MVYGNAYARCLAAEGGIRMLEFLSRLFDRSGRDQTASDNSKSIAKKRLQLVLVQDRINIRPEALELLKNDLIGTIGKHLDIDKEAMDVSLNQEGDQVAIVANIPVLSSRRSSIS